MVKASTALEKFLRAVVLELATREGRGPEYYLAPARGGGKPSFRKAMAGALAHGLRAAFSGPTARPVPAELKPLVDDLLSADSAVLSFVRARNDIAKEDGDPRTGAEVTIRLKKLVERLRRGAGWR